MQRRKFLKVSAGSFLNIYVLPNYFTAENLKKKNKKAAFKTRGLYLHACWEFNYPFAVRSWQRDDYTNMFQLLRLMAMNRVMLWPMMEIAPPPLSEEDVQWFENSRNIISDAQKLGLECWVVSTPNLTSRQEIRTVPISKRHFYPYMHSYRLDKPQEYKVFTNHLESLFTIINNADGYVFIDGDPGGYPGADPKDFVRLFHSARDIINRIGTHPEKQKVIPWIWCGWGTDWVGQGVWKPELQPLVKPVLELLKKNPPGEPWELLPGRSHKEGWANGRINFELTEQAGFINRSTLLTYEIIEFEPTPPAVVLQFEHIRRVIRQELQYAKQSRGILGNAQQPIMSLPNLYFFSRCTYDPNYLDKSDEQVLSDFADFLGGKKDILIPAWSCLQLEADKIPTNLPLKLRETELNSEAASYLPGGPRLYLQILADHVESRLAVLCACASAPRSNVDAAEKIVQAITALVKWWRVHRYVFSGQGSLGFNWEYVHSLHLIPLTDWVSKYVQYNSEILSRASGLLADKGIIEQAKAENLLTTLLKGEIETL